MKASLIFLGILFSTVISFAGPEEHINAQSCYGLAGTPGVYLSDKVPTEICLETLTINASENTIQVYSYFASNQMLFQNTQLTHLTRVNEDYYSFSASSIFTNEWNSGCRDAETNELVISGRVDSNGDADVSTLKLTLKNETTNDTCHSRPQTHIFEYILR